jgi:hypothetical protein
MLPMTETQKELVRKVTEQQKELVRKEEKEEEPK